MQPHQWLKGKEMCKVTLWSDRPLSVTALNFTILEITETDPDVRRNTVPGRTKPAVLGTVVVIKVPLIYIKAPLFVEQGELIKADIRTAAYVDRAKK